MTNDAMNYMSKFFIRHDCEKGENIAIQVVPHPSLSLPDPVSTMSEMSHQRQFYQQTKSWICLVPGDAYGSAESVTKRCEGLPKQELTAVAGSTEVTTRTV